MKSRKLALESLGSRELLTSLLGGDTGYPTIPDMPVADLQYAENDLITQSAGNLQVAESAGDAMIHYIPPDPQPWDITDRTGEDAAEITQDVIQYSIRGKPDGSDGDRSVLVSDPGVGIRAPG